MTDSQKKVCKQVVEHYGYTHQLAMLGEECMELSLAVHRFLHRKDRLALMPELLKELSDVTIMMEQVKSFIQMDIVELEIEAKIQRISIKINK